MTPNEDPTELLTIEEAAGRLKVREKTVRDWIGRVIDMGEGGLQTLEKLIGCTLDEAFALLSGRGVLATNWQPANKNASQPAAWSELEGTETA